MEPDINQMLLEQLRDIHLPEAIGWWPLAFGWWILIGLVLAIIGLSIWLFIRHRAANRYRTLAHDALQLAFASWQQNDDAAAYVQAANAVLKRALSICNPQQSLSLSGTQWIKLLATYTPVSISETTAKALSEAGYQANPDIDVPTIHTEVNRWIQTHKRPINTDLEASHV